VGGTHKAFVLNCSELPKVRCRNSAVKITAVPTEIRTKHLLNTIQDVYHYTGVLGIKI
jgi:hypothetical protein